MPVLSSCIFGAVAGAGMLALAALLKLMIVTGDDFVDDKGALLEHGPLANSTAMLEQLQASWSLQRCVEFGPRAIKYCNAAAPKQCPTQFKPILPCLAAPALKIKKQHLAEEPDMDNIWAPIVKVVRTQRFAMEPNWVKPVWRSVRPHLQDWQSQLEHQGHLLVQESLEDLPLAVLQFMQQLQVSVLQFMQQLRVSEKVLVAVNVILTVLSVTLIAILKHTRKGHRQELSVLHRLIDRMHATEDY